VFVWVFHRVSGILLAGILALQLLTGLFQASLSSSEFVRTLAGLHKHSAFNCLLAFLVSFHACYGFRTILMDLGVKREKELFWGFTVLAAVLFGVFVVLARVLVGG
jgi:succinate dehydrogenase cytochrome b556 subunit